MAEKTSTRLLALLDDERNAIRKADYATLDKLATEKEALFLSLRNADADQADLAAIKKRLDQNQMLLGAAIKGVADARERLSAMRQVREGLNVYDKSGQVSKVHTRRSELEKKA